MLFQKSGLVFFSSLCPDPVNRSCKFSYWPRAGQQFQLIDGAFWKRCDCELLMDISTPRAAASNSYTKTPQTCICT